MLPFGLGQQARLPWSLVDETYTLGALVHGVICRSPVAFALHIIIQHLANKTNLKIAVHLDYSTP